MGLLARIAGEGCSKPSDRLAPEIRKTFPFLPENTEISQAICNCGKGRFAFNCANSSAIEIIVDGQVVGLKDLTYKSCMECPQCPEDFKPPETRRPEFVLLGI